MLVIGRKEQEGIVLYFPDRNPIHILVTNIRPGQVRIGIEASENVRILRDEFGPPRPAAKK